MKAIFSFVLEDDALFVYEGWHLAQSLIEHCGGDASNIHVQCTPEVKEYRRALFRELGCNVHHLERFGDGKHCNKLGQLENLAEVEFDTVVLLDTDTITVSDLRPYLSTSSIRGKAVDLAIPPRVTLDEIAAAAGLTRLPDVCTPDAVPSETYVGNCNGGFYSIPKAQATTLSSAWRRAASWLLGNLEPLSRIGRQVHVDQVSFWLAIQQTGVPFELAPSNVNYYVHFTGEHRYFDASREIALLHYHGVSLNVLGLLEPRGELDPVARAAVARANEQIARGFDNRVFWEMRYNNFPERGSGFGSRGEHGAYKRDLLRQQGIEAAASVLDVGCGDLEVVKALDIKNYVGLDQSPESLQLARRARPDWRFDLFLAADVEPAEMVLCFEVLIHQPTAGGYHALIDFLAAKTSGALLVSGYEAASEAIHQNHMLFFHEPLEASLQRTGRFSAIREIGRHTGVVIYRCDR